MAFTVELIAANSHHQQSEGEKIPQPLLTRLLEMKSHGGTRRRTPSRAFVNSRVRKLGHKPVNVMSIKFIIYAYKTVPGFYMYNPS